jgi:hypothetical protein
MLHCVDQYSLLTFSSLGTLQGFLGAFEKFRLVTVGFVMNDCPSVRVEQLGIYPTDFHEVLY